MLLVLPSARWHPGRTTKPHLWSLRMIGYRGGLACQVFRGRSHRRVQHRESGPSGIAGSRQSHRLHEGRLHPLRPVRSDLPHGWQAFVFARREVVEERRSLRQRSPPSAEPSTLARRRREDFERLSISAIPSSKSPRPIAMSNEDTKRGMSSSLWDMNSVSRQPPVKRGDRILRRALKESEDGKRIVGCPPPW